MLVVVLARYIQTVVVQTVSTCKDAKTATRSVSEGRSAANDAWVGLGPSLGMSVGRDCRFIYGLNASLFGFGLRHGRAHEAHDGATITEQ